MENLKNEKMEEKELTSVVDVLENEENVAMEKAEERNYMTTKKVTSTLKDKKLLFNLNDHVDFKLNDMEGKTIKLKNIVIKTYEKTDKETGEISNSIVTVLLDESNTSYVTASKLFAMRVRELIECYGEDLEKALEDGIDIRITKTEHKDSKNKKLGFELL